MSSPFGHGLAVLSIYTATGSQWPRTWREWAWIGWLLVVGWMPDIDYAFKALGIFDANVRWTHSLVFCLFLPLATVLLDSCRRSGMLKHLLIQLVGAALSHLVLDLLVGVWPMSLLWPFSGSVFRLPFGLLPSAGRPGSSSVYFYRNLLIEVGVLTPILGLTVLLPSAGRPGLSSVYFYRNLLIEVGVLTPILGLTVLLQRKLTAWRWGICLTLVTISLGFMYWAHRLSR